MTIVAIVRVLDTTIEQSVITTNNKNPKKIQPNQKCVDFMITDPISNMLTSIRNGNSAGHEKVEFPASKIKAAICKGEFSGGFLV